MPPEHIASYLSGQVIGTEIAHAQVTYPPNTSYVVLASPDMGGRYVKAMEVAGLRARLGDPAAIVRGLALIAHEAGLIA
jgi:2-keto-3-deoxy-galactonokinase